MSKAETIPSRIPDFASYEEEAAFWDSHGIADYEDELEPVDVEFGGPIGHVLSVRLGSKDFRRLIRLARIRNVSFIALAEGWVLDALDRAEAEDGTTATSDPMIR